MPFGGSSPTLFRPGRWGSLWDGPTMGFTHVTSDRPVTVRWRRFSTGFPWYSQGSVRLNRGGNVLLSGGPALFMRLEVDPTTPAALRAS